MYTLLPTVIPLCFRLDLSSFAIRPSTLLAISTSLVFDIRRSTLLPIPTFSPFFYRHNSRRKQLFHSATNLFGHNSEYIDILAHDLISWMLRRQPSTRPTIEQVLAHPFLCDDGSLDEQEEIARLAPSIEEYQVNEGDKSDADPKSESRIASPEPETAVLETVYLNIIFSSAEAIVGETLIGSWSEVFMSWERVGLTRHASWPEVMSAE